MLCHHFMGWADDEELFDHLEKLKQADNKKTSERLRGFFFSLSHYSYCFALFQKSLTFPDAFILIKSSFFARFISFTYYSDTQF